MEQLKFFQVTHDSNPKITPWIQDVLVGEVSLPACPICHSNPHCYQGIVEVRLWNGRGVIWPDWLGGADSPPVILSERVLDILKAEGVGDFSRNKLKIAQPVTGLLKAKVAPEYFWIDDRTINGAELDFEASRFVNPKRCSGCGITSYDVVENIWLHRKEKHPLVFRKNSWRGAKFFSANGLIFCTEEVVKIAGKHRFTNFRFIPIEEGQGYTAQGIDYLKIYGPP